MADLVKLGLLDLDVPTLDTTYEKGVWWSQVQPRNLTTHHRPTDGSDFRNLPYRSGSWHQIAFDPPYCVDEETEILTATGWKRYDEVTVMRQGKPTTEKTWKVRAEKDLPFEVDGIIELREARKPVVTGVRTIAFNVPAGGIVPRDQAAFDLDGFLRSLNIDGGDRVYIARKEDPDAFPEPELPVTPEDFGPNATEPEGWEK